MLALLQDKGQRAESAGVGVRNIMLRLINPTKEVTDALGKLGVEQERVAGLLRAGMIIEAMELLTQSGLDAASAAKIFGAETVSAALAIGESTDDIRRLEGALVDSGGAAKRMADTQMEGLPGAIKELQSAFEGAQIAIGDAGLTAFLEEMADRLKNAVQWFAGLRQGYSGHDSNGACCWTGAGWYRFSSQGCEHRTWICCSSADSRKRSHDLPCG